MPLSLGAIPEIGVFLAVFVYSMALWNPLRQGLHDKAAGTVVVRNALAIEPPPDVASAQPIDRQAMTTTTSPAPTVSPAVDLDLLDRAGLLGGDLVLHLHRLEHDDGLTDLDRLADLDEHLDDGALHRHLDVAAADRRRAAAAR